MIEMQFFKTVNIENIGIIVEEVIENTYFLRVDGESYYIEGPLQKIDLKKNYPEEYTNTRIFFLN
ncbi:MAG: hypothetical protein OEY51_11235 [Cyclobacteriaceae bacterium]|nr:hypothetical protein [Cyclobacteriaceae bacterium]